MLTLPIHDIIDDIQQVFESTQKLLLSAPPGSGKTTIVPLELLNEPWLRGKKVIMLEPRRLATRAAASRMATLLGEKVGETVGYQIRFDRKVSDATRIEVVTEGILTRRLQVDPELADVGLIIFDEFHERSLHADLALALSLDVCDGLRDDLKILVMSATLDTGALSKLLGNAPLIRGEGQSYPVDIHYLERPPSEAIPQAMVSGITRALRETEGDLLAFLPGVGEIKRTDQTLKECEVPGVAIVTLYGDLSKQQQDLALKPSKDGRRRIILATSIAETSLTIEGISVVVDSGWSRVPRFNPNSGLSKLETVRVSKASADQRAGRAGRLGPGVCYRLWSEATQAQLQPHLSPEIESADLAPLVLELARWGITDPAQLQWLDLPPKGHYQQAKSLLTQLRALSTEGQITAHGQQMNALATHPRLAHMLLQAKSANDREVALGLAALLTEKDPIRPTSGGQRPVDIDLRLRLLQDWRESKRSSVGSSSIDRSALSRIEQTKQQLGKKLAVSESSCEASIGAAGLLALAYPDRIAQRRQRASSESSYLLSNGRGVVIPEGDVLGNEPYLVVPELDAGQRNGRAYSAIAVDQAMLEWVHQGLIEEGDRVAWDDATGSVIAKREHRLGALVLCSEPLEETDPEQVKSALFQGIRKRGIPTLGLSKDHHQWLLRLQCLAAWQEEQSWPDASEQGLLTSLEQWLAPWVDGVTRINQLQKLEWQGILNTLLSWDQQQEMERLAPTHLRVPSGSNKRLTYQLDGPPVLAVKLQEMFGLMETPTICAGRIPIQVHLLSPAQRPIQVTQDLPGFWKNTYSEVKKELKGRYPKHYWPDDPMNAIPTAKVRPK